MRLEEYQVNLLLKDVTLDEQAQIKKAIKKQYNVNIGLTPEDLATMKLELLLPLRDMIRGIVLTKTNKPNMSEAYHRLQSKKLPRKTEFGAVEDPEV
ncbi:MAG: hypothetical protein ACE3L7_28415 [Candidatus Pristimantibacillus sp.]